MSLWAEGLAADDRAKHDHYNDLTAAMVFADPLFTTDPEGNPFFVDLCRTYRNEPVVRALWTLAAEGTGLPLLPG